MIAALGCGLALAGASMGSYGRVAVSTDTRGGQGDPVKVVSFGTRLEKDPYLELDLLYDVPTDDGGRFRAVVTPALSGQLFHYDGVWDVDLALRNLYVEADGLTALPLSVWAGSRMLRGDDVHLLDFWPLDDLNTVGGGVALAPGSWRLSAHVGLNRLDGDDWQRQVRTVPEVGGVGETDVLVLDRQRTVVSGRADRLFEGDRATLRARLYGEVHRLPAGTRIVEDDIEEALPADRGALLGGQLSAWGWGEDAFVHVWYRTATGLATDGLLAIPDDGFATDYTFAAARQHRLALAGNHQTDRVGVLLGAYVQRSADADGQSGDWDDRWEGNVAVRPQVFLTDHVSLGVEASHQELRPDGLNPRTSAPSRASVTKLAVLPALQPGRGSFSRPQIRLQYIVSFLNEDALDLYEEQDTRTRYYAQHFVGLGAEWWINSASYR